MAWLRMVSLVLPLVSICFCTSNAGLDPVIASLMARVEALEQKALSQSEQMLQQEMTIESLLNWKKQHQNCCSYKSSIATSLKYPLDQYEGMDTYLRHVHQSNGIVKDVDRQTDKENRETSEQTETISENINVDTNAIWKRDKGNEHSGIGRGNRIVMPEGEVAFHAVIATGDSPMLGVHQKIVFDHTLVNIGGGYHNLHGLFIAPIAGLYIFSTSVMSHGVEDLNVSLMKNGLSLAMASGQSGAGRFDQGCVTIVTQVTVGDEIYVQHQGGGTQIIYGGGYSSFMGCLISSIPM